MKKISVIGILLTYVLFLQAQDDIRLLVQASPGKTIEIKWLSAHPQQNNNYLLYRRAGSGPWEKITNNPSSRITAAEAATDPQLLSYVQFIDKAILLKGDELNNAEFGFLVRATYDKKFAQALGVYYEDKNVSNGISYQYKLIQIENGTEKDIAISAACTNSYVKAAAPGGLTAVAKGNSVELKWKAEEKFSSYRLYKRAATASNSSLLSKIPVFVFDGNPPYYSRDSFSPAGTYYYKVCGLDAFGNESQFTAEIKVEVKGKDNGEKPIIESVENKSNQALINWKMENMSAVIGYNIYRSETLNSTKTKLNSSPLKNAELSYTDTKATLNSSYYYFVEAIKSTDGLSYSEPFLFNFRDALAPTIPMGLQATSLAGAIQLSWTKNSDKDLKGYVIYRASRDEENAYILLSPKSFNQNTYIDSLNKSLSTVFYYRVASVDSSYNQSEWSQAVSARLKDITAPYAPLLREVLPSSNGIVIRWQKNPEEDIKAYDVYRKEIGGSAQKLNSMPLPAGIDSFEDRTATQSIYYEYYVLATDQAGNVSEKSNTLSAKLLKSESGIQLSAGAQYDAVEKTVVLKWNDTGTVPLKGYTVYRKADGKEHFIQISNLLSANGFVDRQLGSLKKLQYRVRLIDAQGIPHDSNIVDISIP